MYHFKGGCFKSIHASGSQPKRRYTAYQGSTNLRRPNLREAYFRPIYSTKGTHKFLSNLLQRASHFLPIRCFGLFVSEERFFHMEGNFMASFDAENLFPIIPLDECID